MEDYTACYELLQSVHALGPRLQEALDQGDLGRLATLLVQRGRLLARLEDMPRPPTDAPQWNQLTHAIADQQQHLLHQLRTFEGSLSETLGSVTRFNRAREQYTTGGPQAPGILHRHVRG